ncbi:MAG: TIR domain-containing protein [Alphaproteobacteria bacterium]|nr:TIR domain-containing protein [Alphaproteobacteria bacterium]
MSHRLFVSYAIAPDAHVDRVIALVAELAARGFDVVFDRDHDHPPEGWSTWMQRELAAADRIVVVCTPAYLARARGEVPEGEGRAVAWEWHLCRGQLYDGRGHAGRIVPVSFDAEGARSVPEEAWDLPRYDLGTDEGVERLVAALRKPLVVRPRPPGRAAAPVRGDVPDTRLVRALVRACDRRGWPVSADGVHVGSVVVPLETVAGINRRILDSRWYTHLPPILGSDEPLPMASMFVELSLASSASEPNPLLLAERPSLATELNRRRARRRQRRVDLEAFLELPASRFAVVLGDPGSGKSSLVRRIALDVAQDRAPRWTTAVVVPLALWWEACGQHGVDLAAFGLAQLLDRTAVPGSVTPAEVARRGSALQALDAILSEMDRGEESGVLWLVDGLDELAGNPEATRAATLQIRALAARFGCIVTSRPAGFLGGLDEQARFVLLELDDDDVHTLVVQWFAHQGEGDGASSALLTQIDGNPRLQEMARNPFLCTLLCLLAQSTNGPVPAYRPDVYERVLDLAREQAVSRTQEPSCFDQESRDALARCCAWLHTDAPHAPRHLFSDDDWRRCDPRAPDLVRRVLPARVVTRWGAAGDYHLMHLTMHEYLVARHLVDATPADALPELLRERRYLPQWRVILRFAGALWWMKGDRDAFKALLVSLLDPPDLLGKTCIDVAWILVDAGVEDTTSLLGEDLRETLWSVWAEGQPFLQDAASQALGILCRDWLWQRVLAVMEGAAEAPQRAEGTSSALELVWLGEPERREREADLRVLRLLAELRDDDAVDLLFEVAFGGGSADARYVAVDTLADIGTRRVRTEFARRAADEALSDTHVALIARFAARARHHALVPWLCDRLLGAPVVVEAPGVDASVPEDRREPLFVTLLGTIGELADPDAIDVIGRWVLAQWPVADEELGVEAAAIVLETVGAIVLEHDAARPQALAVRETVQGVLGDEAWQLVRAAAVAWTLAREDELLAWLDDPSERSEILDGLGDAADAGHPIPSRVRDAMERLADEGDDEAFQALVKAEMCSFLVEGSTPRLDGLRAGLSADGRERRATAAYALGLLEDTASEPTLRALARDPTQGAFVRVNAVQGLGMLPQVGARTLDLLERLLADDLPEVQEVAASALCTHDLARAGRHRGLPTVRHELARRAALRNELVFEAGFVDERGLFHPWTSSGG